MPPPQPPPAASGRLIANLLAQLAFGVTTQRDPQTSSEDVLSYTDLMETGQLIGPRLYSTGPGVFSADNIKSLDEARDVLAHVVLCHVPVVRYNFAAKVRH